MAKASSSTDGHARIAERYDAGIRLGESLDKDMIAVNDTDRERRLRSHPHPNTAQASTTSARIASPESAIHERGGVSVTTR